MSSVPMVPKQNLANKSPFYNQYGSYSSEATEGPQNPNKFGNVPPGSEVTYERTVTERYTVKTPGGESFSYENNPRENDPFGEPVSPFGQNEFGSNFDSAGAVAIPPRLGPNTMLGGGFIC